MNTEKCIGSTPPEHTLSVGRYEESMYFFDSPPCISDYDQAKIDGLLIRNQGVGIMIGSFDEKLSIRMMSGLAGSLLGYANTEDALQESDASLLNMAIADESYLRYVLSGATNETCGFSFKGAGGAAVSVRVCHSSGIAPSGEKMWYISIRRMDELHDALIGEYNRRGFINQVDSMRRDGTDLREYAIICVNIKGFKAINDLFGSEAGDRLLIQTYQHLRCSELKPAVCARKESDKFLLLVKKEDIDFAKLPEMLKIPYSHGEKDCVADSVCGIYYIHNDKIEISTMIDCAKMAKQDIKDAFITPYAVFTPSMRTDYLNRINALSYFDEALANREFKIYYQPVVDCKTGRITSSEALTRWETPVGVIPPAAFIPALEENGCIAKLDKYVTTSAVRYLHARAESGLPLIPISVNVSRMNFFDEERTRQVYELLQRDEIARRYVHFEITETSHRSVKELQADFIGKVNSYGGKVYIDDFGVANSSIDLLSQYDFSVLKLDMQFIRDMTKNRKVRILVEATIHMAHELSMQVIAEGVETEEELALLREMNCDYIQGYYFSKPLDEQRFAEYLHKHLCSTGGGSDP